MLDSDPRIFFSIMDGVDVNFTPGDRVQPISGPYRRKTFEITGVEGDRISVESADLKLVFPAKLLKIKKCAPISDCLKESESLPLPPIGRDSCPPNLSKSIPTDKRSCGKTLEMSPATGTSKPLSQKDSMTSSVGGSLVKTSATQIKKAKDYKESDHASGAKCCALLPPPSQNLLLLKTFPPQETVINTGSILPSQTLSDWDTQSNGSTYLQVTLEGVTIASALFLWPTPMKTDSLCLRSSLTALKIEHARKSSQKRLPTITAKFLGCYPTAKFYEELMGLPPGWTDISSPTSLLSKIDAELPLAEIRSICPVQNTQLNSVPHMPRLSVGNRVTFTQYWWGEDREFEGEVLKLNQPPGTAIVRYRAPDVARELEIQAPIGLFSLHKVPPELEKLNQDSTPLTTGDSSCGAGGDPLEVAPLGCWIERKVHSGGWVEAVFKSRTAIFPAVRGGGMAKSRYIGKWGSPAHSAAIEAVARRNEAQKQKRWSKRERHGQIPIAPSVLQ